MTYHYSPLQFDNLGDKIEKCNQVFEKETFD